MQIPATTAIEANVSIETAGFVKRSRATYPIVCKIQQHFFAFLSCPVRTLLLRIIIADRVLDCIPLST